MAAIIQNLIFPEFIRMIETNRYDSRERTREALGIT